MLSLSPGDRVALIAPAGQLRTVNRAWLAGAQSLLESWQLQVEVRVETDNHFYLAGSDDRRADHAAQALADPALRAVFCTRGGYGSSRLWPALRTVDVSAPKLLVGHSDITSLHLMARACWPRVECLHGVNLATEQVLGENDHAADNRDALYAELFSPGNSPFDVQAIIHGTARGRLTGGCLSLITASLGTPYALECDGDLLFLEDTGEAPFRLDRALVQLRNAGLFDHVSGVVFGVMPNCTDPYNRFTDIAAELLAPFGIPVAIGLASGHGAINRPLRLGQLTELNTQQGWVQRRATD